MSRRLLATAASAMVMSLTVTPSALAQKTLRIAMTAADIPTTTGMPNNGFEGMRFVGYTAFDALVLWDLSQTERLPDIKPGLATSWKIDEADKTKWVFTLRQGVKFHDGAAFNADAVAWNLARFYDDKAPQFEPNGSAITRARVPLITKWEKIDDYTIAIYTKVPLSYFPFMTAQILLASPAAWEKAGKDWANVAKAPAGTGPFRIARVNPRQSIVMEKNPDYWDKERVPKVDRLIGHSPSSLGTIRDYDVRRALTTAMAALGAPAGAVAARSWTYVGCAAARRRAPTIVPGAPGQRRRRGVRAGEIDCV